MLKRDASHGLSFIHWVTWKLRGLATSIIINIISRPISSSSTSPHDQQHHQHHHLVTSIINKITSSRLTSSTLSPHDWQHHQHHHLQNLLHLQSMLSLSMRSDL